MGKEKDAKRPSMIKRHFSLWPRFFFKRSCCERHAPSGVLVFGLALGSITLAMACHDVSARKPVKVPPSKPNSSTVKQEPTAAIETPHGSILFDLEIASTPEQRRQGLIHRESLPAQRGMLFVFPDEKPRSFWMKNTPISLDIIFINSERKIVGIIENAEPFSLEPLRVEAPAQYVLEVGGGLSRRQSIVIGQRVGFIGVPEKNEIHISSEALKSILNGENR